MLLETKPVFEFAGPDKSAPKPVEVKVEAKNQPTENKNAPKDTSPEGIGKSIAAEFTTPEQLQIVAAELAKSFSEKIGQFSPQFRQQYCNENGEPDMRKILTIFKLDQHLGNQLAPDKKAPSAPNSTPNATVEFNTASAGKLPDRPSDAATGAQFMAEMNKLGNMNDKKPQAKMEQRIAEEIAKGNIPSFCRPENMKALTMSNGGVTVTYKAGLDYLAIGSDDNFVRVPMTPLLAQALATKYGWGLPTGAMTDHIYAKSDIKLHGVGYITAPAGTPENHQQQMKMQGNEYILRHNNDINKQLGPDGLHRLQSGQALIAGGKKDVILSRYAIDHPGKLDFRGLYQGGQPVQRSPAHEDTYRDYSHGFRPIDANVTVAYPDGRSVTMKYYDALKDPKIAKVLNGYEGAIDAHQAYNHPRPGQLPTNVA